jgi:gliding motility-associated-like protein
MIFAEFFSPNGDDVNDYFVIKNIEEYPINKMHIFNRWGDLVYTSEPYKNEWNGISNAKNQYFGAKVPDGIYFFKFEYLIGDFQENRNGKVILMR